MASTEKIRSLPNLKKVKVSSVHKIVENYNYDDRKPVVANDGGKDT